MNNINNQVMKNNNALLVLNTIRANAPIARTELVRKVGITAASVINITNDMLHQGILVEKGKSSEGGQGRKSIVLDVNPSGAYVIGAQLSADSVIAGAFDLSNQSVFNTDEDINCRASSEEIIGKLEYVIEKAIEAVNKVGGSVIGIGLALPGPLDVESGVITNPPNLPNMAQCHIKGILEERFGLPVCCDRESNDAVLAEYSNDAQHRFYSIFFLSLFKTGVGGGFVSGGNVLHGLDDGAGEIGHTTVDIDGPQCRCGNYGCLEAMVSEEAIMRRIGKAYRLDRNFEVPVAGSKPATIEEVFNRSKNGDPVCSVVIAEAASYIALALGNAICLYSPEAIYIGGSMVEMYPQIADLIRARIHARKSPIQSYKVVVEKSTLGSLVFIYGAAESAWQKFLPDLVNRGGIEAIKQSNE